MALDFSCAEGIEKRLNIIDKNFIYLYAKRLFRYFCKSLTIKQVEEVAWEMPRASIQGYEYRACNGQEARRTLAKEVAQAPPHADCPETTERHPAARVKETLNARRSRTRPKPPLGKN